MKGAVLLLGLALALQTARAIEPVQTLDDLDNLKLRARQNGRCVVLFFTAAEGVAPSSGAEMRAKYLRDRKFMAWVERYAVFGEVDISAGKGQFDYQRKAYSNLSADTRAIVHAMHMPDLPAIALYQGDGTFLDWAAPKDDPAEAVTRFQDSLRLATRSKTPGAAGTNQPKTSTAAAQPATPAWVTPISYDTLRLKLITGTPQRRLATINNESFLAGETHKVTLGTNRVPVKCLEIRDQSVLVKVEGEAAPRLLALGMPATAMTHTTNSPASTGLGIANFFKASRTPMLWGTLTLSAVAIAAVFVFKRSFPRGRAG